MNHECLLNEESEKRFKFGRKIRDFGYFDKGIYDTKEDTIMVTYDEIAEKMNELAEENEQLKERVYDFEKRKIIEESEMDEDVIPRIKLLRTELFGEKYE